MPDAPLWTVEVHPAAEADAAVIWLHGLGASAYDFASVPPQLELPDGLHVRFVFPNAPSIPVTLNAGLVMPAWYDIESLDERGHDEEGVVRSTRQVETLVRRETERGVSPDRIVLAGFSQGGAIALHAGLRYPERLAGLLGLSCYLLREASLEAEASAPNRSLPVFLGHGLHDPMVPRPLGVMARERLEAHGCAVSWHEYPIEHSVSLQEIRDVGRWLAETLSR